MYSGCPGSSLPCGFSPVVASRGSSLLWCVGFSCGARALECRLQQWWLLGSRAHAQELWARGLAAPWSHVESSQTRESTWVPSIGRQIFSQGNLFAFFLILLSWLFSFLLVPVPTFHSDPYVLSLWAALVKDFAGIPFLPYSRIPLILLFLDVKPFSLSTWNISFPFKMTCRCKQPFYFSMLALNSNIEANPLKLLEQLGFWLLLFLCDLWLWHNISWNSVLSYSTLKIYIFWQINIYNT